MLEPKSVHDALRRVQTLLSAAGRDIEQYLEEPAYYSPEYFRDVLEAVLDAHMLTTWTRDNLTKGEKK